MRLNQARQAQRAIAVLAAITDKGQTAKELLPITAAMGLGNMENFRLLLKQLLDDGRLCFAHAKTGTGRAAPFYFTSKACRDEFLAVEILQRKLRAAIRHKTQSATRRALRKSLAALDPVPVPKAPKAPKKCAAPANPRKPKKVKPTNPAKALKRAGTETPKVPTKQGPAYWPGAADASRAKIIRIETPRPRFAVDAPALGGFSNLRPGQYAFEPVSCAARAA